jgi:hypothetical protein
MLEAKEEEYPTEEAERVGAFTQLLGGPSGRQAGAILLPAADSRDDRHSSEHSMDSSDAMQTPIACIQTGQEQEEMSFLLLPLAARRFPYFCPIGY